MTLPDRAAGAAPAAAAADASPGAAAGFEVHLDNFSGPFDLLLSLIAKHRLDITEVALARVTDEFVAYLRSRGDDWQLDQVSEFLVVAATLLDLKAARLLPSGDVEDPEDVALLEARDLLFARLLQYRAYQEVAGTLASRMAQAGLRVPRAVPLEPQLAALLPELVLAVTPEQLARLAARALTPRPAPVVELEHLHAPVVSVREQAGVLARWLQRGQAISFRTLVADASGTDVVVARFLALLELFRQDSVAFDQPAPFGELMVRWTGRPVPGDRVLDDLDAALAPEHPGDEAAEGSR